MIPNQFQEVNNIANGFKKGEIFGAVLGGLLLGFTIYAFALTIKVNKLTLRKLNDEGYQ